MEISQEQVRALRSASRLGDIHVDEAVGPLMLAALASGLNDGEGLPTGTAGISWLGERGEVNTLLQVGERFVHARADGGRASATNYPGPVAAVEAANITKLTSVSGYQWRVTTWHVTLADGAVISLRSEDAGHAEAVADFVRTRLLP